MYNPKSLKAEEFIDHQEILDTLAYADENKNNVELIDQILNKARERKGLSHREASVLLACELEGIASRVFFAGERVQALFEDCFAYAAALTAEPAHALERASLRAGLLFLLQAIVRQSRNGTPAYSPPIAGVLAYFEEHLDERVLLRDAAQHTGMSLEQLKRRFRREVGIPPADYLLRRKVQAACDQ